MTTMLIVDDSRLSRIMVKNTVKKEFADWEFIEAGSGDEALQLVSDRSIDIMTVDLNMPGMTGLELVEKLKPMYPKAKISLLTANIQTSIRAQAETLNIGFIEKPITEEKILTFVRA